MAIFNTCQEIRKSGKSVNAISIFHSNFKSLSARSAALRPACPQGELSWFGKWRVLRSELVLRSASEEGSESGDVIAIIGPEGGITEGEKALLESCGAKFVRLTDTILRVETAALAFAAVLAVWRDNR